MGTPDDGDLARKGRNFCDPSYEVKERLALLEME